jgi:hypothetical protein
MRRQSYWHAMPTLAAGLWLLLATAGAPRPATSPPAPSGAAALDCSALATARDWGGLPDAPTQLTAVAVAATEYDPAYCRISGYIAPQVHFELRLPTGGWDGRYYQAGCGGLCGTLAPSAECLEALRRGLAVGFSDLGHQGAGGQWGSNDWQLRVDFAYRANHVLAIVAKQVIAAYYGQPPRAAYFVGCSDGGREALMEAQRFPDDFDGIVAGAPALLFAPLNGINQPWKAQANLDAQGLPILLPEQLPLVHDAVLAACDGLDGLVDGLIDEPRACQFDPGVLRCGAAVGPQCLTDAQVEVVRRLYSGPVDAAGQHLYPGGLAYGSELNWAGQIVAPAGALPGFARIGTDFVRYLSRPLPQPLDRTALDVPFTREWFDDLRAVGTLYNAADPALHAFRARGGKLILYHGWADPDIPPQGTIAYYAAVQDQMGGLAATQQFARLFLLPGVGHCGGGAAPQHVDWLTAIIDWVEHGVAPDRLIAAQYANDGPPTMPPAGLPPDAAGARSVMEPSGPPVRTRPLFPYPLRAQYLGEGSPDDASSFRPVPLPPLVDHYDWIGQDLFTPATPFRAE